jgi:hypothetical protein
MQGENEASNGMAGQFSIVRKRCNFNLKRTIKYWVQKKSCCTPEKWNKKQVQTVNCVKLRKFIFF